METREALETLGLNEKQAAVYTALLQIGHASAYAVALKSGLKNPTAYVVLGELAKKGLAHRVPRAKKRLYVARPPEEAFAVAEEKLKVAKSVLPELLAMAGMHGAPVRTRYFEGPKQVKDAYFDTLEHGKGEIAGWISDSVFKEVGHEQLYRDFQPKRIKRGIKARLILPNTPTMEKYSSDDAATLKETRTDQSLEYKPASEMLIYGEDRVAITSFEEVMALIIESKKIHDLMKGIFEAHWRALGKT